MIAPFHGLGITDSSAIISLQRIDQTGVLVMCFDRLLVPPAVANEVGELPPGIVVSPRVTPPHGLSFPSTLHRGEVEAIILAMTSPGCLLVLDDLRARRFANTLPLDVTGLVGLLIRARVRGRIERLAPLLDQLRQTGTRISDALYLESLRAAGEVL